MSSLKNKVFKGVFWNSIAQFGSQAINFIILLILARLLDPSAFGLLGMVTVFTGFVGYFSELGIVSSLIKSKEISEIDCSSAFWCCIFFGIITYVVLFLAAPFIATFYNEDALTSIVRVVALVFPIASFSFVPLALETRAMRFDRIAIVRLISLAISGGLAIIGALKGLGVWALALQVLVQRTTETIGIVFFKKWKPSFSISLVSIKNILHYGFQVTLNNLLTFLSENVDYLIVGKVVGAASLGLYTMAFRLSKYPVEKLWRIVGKLMFASYSTIQEDIGEQRRLFFHVTSIGVLLISPFISFVFFSTKSVVAVALGQQWIDIVPIVKVLLIYLLFMSFAIGDEPLLSVLNIKILNKLKAIASAIFSIVGVYAAVTKGVIGVAYAYTVVFSFYWICVKVSSLNILEIPWRQFRGYLIKIMSYVCGMFLCGYVTSLMNIKSDYLFLIAQFTIIFFFAFLTYCFFGVISLKKRKLQLDNLIPN